MSGPTLVEVGQVLGAVEQAERGRWNQLVSGLEESQLYSTDHDLGKVLLSHANAVTKIHEYFSALDPGICRTRLTRNGVIKSTLTNIRVVHVGESASSLSDGAMVKEKHTLPYDLYNVESLNADESALYLDALLCASFPCLCVVGPPMTSPSETLSPVRSPGPLSPRGATPRSVRAYSYSIADDEDSLNLVPDTQILDAVDEDEDEEMLAIPPETLCDHMRKCFHLTDEIACHYQNIVYKLNCRSSQSKLLADELVTQMGCLESNTHPYYNPKKFVSRYAYDQWRQWKRSHVTQLLSRFWNSPLTYPKSWNTVLEHRSKHHHYRLLLNKLYRYDNLHRPEGYLTSRVSLLSSASKRLLKEYALRYGVDDFYRRVLHLELTADHFDVSPPFVRYVCDRLDEMKVLLPSDRARIVMVRDEMNLLMEVVERLRKLCVDALGKIKRLYPRNDPPSALENLIDLLKLTVDFTVYLTGTERPSIGDYLLAYSKVSFIATYERYKMMAHHDMQLGKMNEVALSPQLLKTLMKNIIDEVNDYRVNYQPTFEKYVDITRQAACTFYALLMADVRHCCEVIISVPRDDHSLNLSLLSIVYCLSQFDQDLAVYIPIQSRSWQASFTPHLLIWLSSIKLSAQRLVLHAIDKDSFSTLVLPTLHLSRHSRHATPCVHRRPSNTVPLRHSRNSPFTLTSNSVATTPAAFSVGSYGLLYPTSSGYMTASNNEKIADVTSPNHVTGNKTDYSPALRRIKSDSDFGSILICSNHPDSTHSLPSMGSSQSASAAKQSKTGEPGRDTVPSRTKLNNVISDDHNTIGRAEDEYDIVSMTEGEEISLGVSASFLDVYILIERFTNLAKCLLNAAIPLPEFGEREKQSNLLPDLSRYIRETLLDRKRVYLKVLKGLCNIVCLYCDNLAAFDLCALPQKTANSILSVQTLCHLDGLYSSNLLWGCRHTKVGVACDEYRRRNTSVVADKYEPVTKEMCNRVNALVAIVSVLPSLVKSTKSALQAQRLADMIAQKMALDSSSTSDEGEFEWVSSYAVEDESRKSENTASVEIDDDNSSDDPFDLCGKLDEPYEKCLEHAQKLLDNLLEVMAYRLNLFIRTSLSVLLGMSLPNTNTEQRFKPLADFLRMFLDQLSSWLYPSAYRSLLSKIWKAIVKDFEEEIGVLLTRKYSQNRGADMYIRGLTYLVRIMHDGGKGLPIQELMEKMSLALRQALADLKFGVDCACGLTQLNLFIGAVQTFLRDPERVIFVLKLFLEPPDRLVALYYHLDRQSNDSDLGSLTEEPLSKEVLQQMKTDLHRYRKCFSARELVNWIMEHKEATRGSDFSSRVSLTASSKSLAMTEEEKALEICHRLVEHHVICDVTAITDVDDQDRLDLPVTYPKIAVCTDFNDYPGVEETTSGSARTALSKTELGESPSTKIYRAVQPSKPVREPPKNGGCASNRAEAVVRNKNRKGCHRGKSSQTTMKKTSGGKIVATPTTGTHLGSIYSLQNPDLSTPESFHSVIEQTSRQQCRPDATPNQKCYDGKDICSGVISCSASRSENAGQMSSSRTAAIKIDDSEPVTSYDDNFISCQDSQGPLARSSTVDPPNLDKLRTVSQADLTDSTSVQAKASDWTYSSSDEELHSESYFVTKSTISKLKLEPEMTSTPSLFSPIKILTPPPFVSSSSIFYCFASTIESNRNVRKLSHPSMTILLEKLQRPSSLHQAETMAQNMNNMGQPMNSMTPPIGTMGQPMNTVGQSMTTGQMNQGLNSVAQSMGNMVQSMTSSVQSMGGMCPPMNSPGQTMGNIGQAMTNATHVGQSMNSMGQTMTSPGQPMGNMGQPMTNQPMGNMTQPMNTMGQPMSTAGQSMNAMGQSMNTLGQSMTTVSQPMNTVGQVMSTVGQPMNTMGQPVMNQSQPVTNGTIGSSSMSMANSNGGTVLATISPGTPSTLVDEFERGFLSCMAPLMDADMTNQDPDEMRAGVQQSLQKFLESAKALEAFFLQKRLVLSVQKPELLVKEDITELRAELARKEALIQKHYDKLQSWQDMLNNLQQGGQQPTTHPPAQSQASVQNPPTPQPATTARHQTAPMSAPSNSMQSPHHMHQMGPQFPTMRGGQYHPSDMMQGPLAKLERSTANIGMPDGWQ